MTSQLRLDSDFNSDSTLTSDPPLRRRDHEGVAVEVFEDGEHAPRLFGRRRDELDAYVDHFLIGFLDVVARQRAIELPAGLQAVAHVEQDEACVGRSDAQLD